MILFHEIGHYLADQYGIFDQRQLGWSNEFFANLFAYACMQATEPEFAKVWDLFGRAFLAAYLPNFASLSEINVGGGSKGQARIVMQSLLFFVARKSLESDPELIRKLVADPRLKQENSWQKQMEILDSHIPGFSRIEELHWEEG